MRQPLFYVCLGVMMIPYQVILLPQYILFRELGWVNTFLPLIVPSFFAEEHQERSSSSCSGSSS